MSSVTRVPLCAVDFCPFPSEPDFHQCFCGSRLVEHHHVISRGMGGSKKRRNDPANVVCVCHVHHEAVTLHRATIYIENLPWKERGLVYLDEKGNETGRRMLPSCDGAVLPSVSIPDVQPGTALSQAGEGGRSVPAGVLTPSMAKPSPATTGADEPPALLLAETDRGSPVPVGGEGAQSLPPTDLRVPRRMSSPSPLSDVCQEGMRLVYWGLKLKDATDEWRWRIGDWLVQMEEDLGESAYQYFEPVKEAFGYDAIRQYKSVAERVTRVTRVPELPWSHHRAVASLDEKGQKAALLTAQEEGLSSREVAAMVRPEPPERERHACPLCNYEHWVVVEAGWKT